MFVLRNADLRFTNVKAFLSEEDIGRGVFMASVPNDVPIEYIGNGVMDEEAYVAVRLLDLTCICYLLKTTYSVGFCLSIFYLKSCIYVNNE